MYVSPFHSGRFWAGGSDQLTEGEWVWQHSGKPLTFTKWAPWALVHNPQNEDFMWLHVTSTGNMQWRDGKGYESYRSICEVEIY